MKDPQRLLNQLLKLKREFEDQGRQLPPGIAGTYGEILAYKKLKEKLGKYVSVRLFSGQRGADIEIARAQKKLELEVKTSRLKEEGAGMWYGAALNVKKCSRHHKSHTHPKRGRVEGDFCYFDYVIFVALANNFTKARYYVIPRHFLDRNEQLLRNNHRRFSSATHRIIISDGRNMPALTKRQVSLIKKTERFRNRWDLLARALT